MPVHDNPTPHMGTIILCLHADLLLSIGGTHYGLSPPQISVNRGFHIARDSESKKSLCPQRPNCSAAHACYHKMYRSRKKVNDLVQKASDRSSHDWKKEQLTRALCLLKINGGERIRTGLIDINLYNMPR